MDQNAVPKFHRSRTVPFAICEKIEKELDRLESQGPKVLLNLSVSLSVSLVPIVKGDGSVRFVGITK